jgi:hypothetical protein
MIHRLSLPAALKTQGFAFPLDLGKTRAEYPLSQFSLEVYLVHKQEELFAAISSNGETTLK